MPAEHETRRGWRRTWLVVVRHARRFWYRLSVGGCLGALLFFAASMTPSLLPRAWPLQGVASGLSVGIGYGIGTFAGWLLVKMGFKPLAGRRLRVVRGVLIGLGIVIVPLFGVLGSRWQREVRELVQMPTSDTHYYALVLVIAFLLARFLVGTARVLRTLVRRLTGFGSRFISPAFARVLAVVLVGTVLVTLLNDTLGPALLSLANHGFSISDTGTAMGATRPQDPERSGSPESLTGWDQLGMEGRGFVAFGPTAEQIAAFTGTASMTPIRAYAGLDSVAGEGEQGLQEEADLVVRELVRTRAFDRKVLAVATTTGRGWVNQATAAALEYMYGGDTAIAAMQYSFLPSPVAFVADQATPPLAGKILFQTVRAYWLGLPAARRPKLVVMGESLGSYGSQGAFDGTHGVLDEVDAAVWTGTPNFTDLWSRVTGNRKPGSWQQVPDYDGCTRVCFAGRAADIPAGAHPTVLYLQHPTDPVVWWSPDLILKRPDWLAQGAPPGRRPGMVWVPVVTFWQITMDMVFSSSMPDGYGHHYGADFANAWAAVLPPPGWTDSDTQRLRVLLGDGE